MKYAVKRVAAFAATMLLVSLFTFFAFALIPGDPAEVLLGTDATPARVAALRAELGLDPEFYQTIDVHIHVPEGAVPKDGPSAGVTMTTALVSALTRKPVRQNVAMTGEITLRGRVLPIGGLKEKTLAAYRAGINTLIIPEENKKDLEKIPDYVLEKFKIIPVKEIQQVLSAAIMEG